MRTAIRTDAFLANLPLFRGLPPGDIARLAEGTTRRVLKRGETLFEEGQPSIGVHALVYGRIALFNRTGDGRERVVDLVAPGRSFGEPVLFLEKPYIVSAKALADSLVLQVAKETVFAELSRNPRFASRIIGALAERAESLVRQLQDAAIGSGTRRLAGWLLRQPASSAHKDEDVVSLGISKRVLAARLKVSAEHLSRILHDLSAAGLIAVRGREIIVADRPRLEAIAAGAEERDPAARPARARRPSRPATPAP